MEKKVYLVSHGRLAEGVVSAIEMVFGPSDALSYLGLAPDGNVVELIGELRSDVEAHPETQFVVLADIFGGSVCNQCLEQLSAYQNVKLLAGLSMPLALGVLMAPGQVSDEALEQAVADARAGTKVVELISADSPVDSGEDDFF